MMAMTARGKQGLLAVGRRFA